MMEFFWIMAQRWDCDVWEAYRIFQKLVAEFLYVMALNGELY